MGFSDVWNRTLVYFGIAEDEEWDEDGLETQEELDREYRSRSTRQNVRRLPRRREPDGWTDDSQSIEAAPAAVATSSRSSRPTRLRSADTGKASVHLVLPRSFNDAQQIADKFKDSVPVILNLQSADNELSKRLIDFASGLTYALNGSMQRVADKVFLLTPRNVEVSAEERARMLDKGGFFNQALTVRRPAKLALRAAASQGSYRRTTKAAPVGSPTVFVLADTASAVQQFVEVFFDVYILLIFAYVLTSWIRMPYCAPSRPTVPRRRLRALHPHLSPAAAHRRPASTCPRSSPSSRSSSSSSCWSG